MRKALKWIVLSLLALMVLTILALCAWPFRPSARKSNEAAANMIFAEDSLGGDENGE